MNILTYNARSLLDLNKRTKFANVMTSVSLDVICITETWLTPDIPNAALFLPNYHIYRSDRKIDETRITKRGGVMIAINSYVDQSLKLYAQTMTTLFVNSHATTMTLYYSAVYTMPPFQAPISGTKTNYLPYCTN